MSAVIIYWTALLAQLMLAAIRLVRGPRAQDRVLALDTLFNIAMLMLLVLGIKTGSPHFFPAALLIAGIGFVSTVALAKFLMRGEVIE